MNATVVPARLAACVHISRNAAGATTSTFVYVAAIASATNVFPVPTSSASFSELLPAGDARNAVVAVEYLVQRGDYGNAVQTAARFFDEGQLGDGLSAGEGPAYRALMLGIAGDRYSRFREAAGRAQGGACASDAFYPFEDGIEAAAGAGVAAVIQPGGAMRDDAIIEKADELGLAMVFTGERHFLH